MGYKITTTLNKLTMSQENNTQNNQELDKQEESLNQQSVNVDDVDNQQSNLQSNDSEKDIVISKIQAENQQLQQKVTDLNDKLLRSLAEIENRNRKAREEIEKTAKFAISNFVGDIIPVVENFFLASNNAPKPENSDEKAVATFIDAMFMTQKELIKTLEKHQVIRINPINQLFDHNLHEAISQIPTENDDEDGKIVNVIQAGYKIADRLIKPALVVVAKKN